VRARGRMLVLISTSWPISSWLGSLIGGAQPTRVGGLVVQYHIRDVGDTRACTWRQWNAHSPTCHYWIRGLRREQGSSRRRPFPTRRNLRREETLGESHTLTPHRWCGLRRELHWILSTNMRQEASSALAEGPLTVTAQPSETSREMFRFLKSVRDNLFKTLSTIYHNLYVWYHDHSTKIVIFQLHLNFI
jgi:hypothetical protein